MRDDLIETFSVPTCARRLALSFARFHRHADVATSTLLTAQFLDQFPNDLRQQAAVMLDAVRIIELGDIIDFILSVAADIRRREGRRVWLVPSSLGSARRIVTCLRQRLTPEDGISVAGDLRSALTRVDLFSKTLLLFDDNIVSGTQASSQLMAWSGQAHAYDQGVDATPLTDRELALLAEVDVRWAFYVASAVGVARLGQLWGQVANRRSALGIYSAVAAEDMSGRSWVSDELRDFLALIGRQVYRAKFEAANPDCSDEVVEQAVAERALGFACFEGLYCFDYNVPTSMYTALWCPGKSTKSSTGGGALWWPLFLRSGKHEQFKDIG